MFEISPFFLLIPLRLPLLCPLLWMLFGFFPNVRVISFFVEINNVLLCVFSVLGICILHDEFFSFKIICQVFFSSQILRDCYLVVSLLF